MAISAMRQIARAALGATALCTIQNNATRRASNRPVGEAGGDHRQSLETLKAERRAGLVRAMSAGVFGAGEGLPRPDPMQLIGRRLSRTSACKGRLIWRLTLRKSQTAAISS